MTGSNIRKSWTGQITLGPIELDVVAKPMVGKDEREQGGLKRLCACHHEPFAQQNLCPGKKAPTSEAAIKRGDKNLTDVVKGVETDDGSYVVIDPAVIEDIEESAYLGESIQIEEVVAPATATNPQGFPMHLGVKAFYIAHDKDVTDAAYNVAALHTSLRETGGVAVGKWSQRGPQSLVGIHAVGDVLVMTVVPFGATVREPDALCEAHTTVKVDDADQAAVTSFVTGMTSKAFDDDAYEDNAVAARAEAVEEALKAAKANRKAKIKKGGAPKPVAKKKGSLADLLAESLKQSKAAKPAAKKAPRAKVTA